MPTEISVPAKIIEEIIEGDRVLIILPQDRRMPLGEVEFVTEGDDSERVSVNVVRTSRARVKHVPVSDRVLNGSEDLMETLVYLRQWSRTDLTSDDIVTVVRFEAVSDK